MPKIVVECRDPNDLESVEEAVEQAVGRCNITYFRQAKAMIDVGTASSLSNASEKIAEDTGESPRVVRERIVKGEKDLLGEGRQGIQRKTGGPQFEKKVNHDELLGKFKSGEFKTNKDAAEYYNCTERTIRYHLGAVSRKPKQPKVSKDQIVSEDVQRTFNLFYAEIQNAKMEKWKHTSKEGALKLLGLLYDLINIT